MTVTVLSGPERRRRWTAAEKRRIVDESLAGAASVVEVARRHDIHPNQLHLWRRQARTGAASGARAEGFRFVPVRLATRADAVAPEASGGAASAIEVVLRNGRVLRVPEGAALAQVVTLADALEGREP
jgi:transposase